MEITEAVRTLREKIGDSQQAFATRLGLSIRAVVNYEKDRTPAPRALAAMAHLAAKHRDYELANRFWSALPEEVQYVPVLALPLSSPDLADAEIMVQMLPTLSSAPPKEGMEVALSIPRRMLGRCVRDLDSLIAGDNPAVTGPPSTAIRRVAEVLTKVISHLGQEVKVFPAKVEFTDLRPARRDKTTKQQSSRKIQT